MIQGEANCWGWRIEGKIKSAEIEMAGEAGVASPGWEMGCYQLNTWSSCSSGMSNVTLCGARASRRK